jgi:transcriptional regulator with XRE-family HTH domain
MIEDEWTLGIEHRPYNERMRDARLSLGWTRAELARQSGISAMTVGRYEMMKGWPSATSSVALNVPVDYLWPPHLHDVLAGRPLVTVSSSVPLSECLSLDVGPMRLLAAPDSEDFGPDIERWLSALPREDQLLVRLYYGFDGPPMTLTALAEEIGVTPQRMHQRLRRALSRIRRRMASENA